MQGTKKIQTSFHSLRHQPEILSVTISLRDGLLSARRGRCDSQSRGCDSHFIECKQRWSLGEIEGGGGGGLDIINSYYSASQ